MAKHNKNRGIFAGLVTAGLGCGLCASTAQATFHEWKMIQLYSNASGSVQFVEFQQPSSEFDDERFLSGISLSESAFGHSFSFPANLPAAPVANQKFLLATPGYAALSGVPAADYILPSNDWFSPSADTLSYAFGFDSLAFTTGQLPTDGTSALQRAYGSTTLSTGTNSPTNFAGQAGTIAAPEPGTLGLAAIGMCAGLLRRRPRAIADACLATSRK